MCSSPNVEFTESVATPVRHAKHFHLPLQSPVKLRRRLYSARFHRTPAGEADLAVAQLQWADGLVASFAASYLTPEGMPPRGFDRMEVFGANWSARINPNPRPIEVWGERAFWPMAPGDSCRPHRGHGHDGEELRCFCRVVRGQQSVPVGATYGDALQVQQWMDRLAS